MLPIEPGELTLLVVVGTAFAVQILFYLAALPKMTEKYFDLSGAITYWACIIISFVPLFTWRSLILSIFVLVWSGRLGAQLFMRIKKTGGDNRFEQYKTGPLRFFVVWFVQGIWVSLTPLAVYILNSTTDQADFVNWADIVGWVIWVMGWGCEVLADWQKNNFKNKNPRDFCNVGLWKFSRHPNYFGEILLWIGMYVAAAAGYTEIWQYLVALVAPIWTFCLLRFMSGVPPLEKSWKERYGDRQDFQEWKAKTNLLVPWFPKKSNAGNAEQV